MIIQQCCNRLEQLALKIAFIESASSGYLSSQFSIYKQSGADILLGGLVSYEPSIKVTILNINPHLIEQFTAESAEVTEAMATQGKLLFTQADLIIGCTGLLKPGGSAHAEKPEGTFYICILFNGVAHNFSYFIAGSALDRLNVLTEMVAREILNILNESRSI